MEQLTRDEAVATSQKAAQNQNEPQLRDENAPNDKSVHRVLTPSYQARLRRDAVQQYIEAERETCEESQPGKTYSSGRLGAAVDGAGPSGAALFVTPQQLAVELDQFAR